MENWERGESIAEEMLTAEGNFENGLCNTLKRLFRDEDLTSPEKLADKLVEYMQIYNCP